MTAVNQNKIFFVVEGPSGSGKTRLINKLAEAGLWKPIEPAPVTRPRSYPQQTGAILSQYKDYWSTIQIAKARDNEVSVLDRWMISQWVYHKIRTQSHAGLSITEGDKRRLSGLIRLGLSSIVWASLELEARYPMNRPSLRSDDIKPFFIFLVPELALLGQLRSTAEGREYPYPAPVESALFRSAFKLLKEDERVPGEKLLLTPENLDGYDQMIENLPNLIAGKVMAAWK